MRRGSTVTEKYTIPIPTDQIKEIRITFSQNGEAVLEKKTADCTFSGHAVTIQLSQVETLSFTAGVVIAIQIRVKLLDGNVIPMKERYVFCRDTANEEVL